MTNNLRKKEEESHKLKKDQEEEEEEECKRKNGRYKGKEAECDGGCSKTWELRERRK